MKITVDNVPQSQTSGPVQVNPDDSVRIQVADQNNNPNYFMAPVRILLHTWAPGEHGAPQTVTTEMMNNSDTAMISPINFVEDHDDIPTLAYTGSASSPWETSPSNIVSPYGWGGADAGRNVEHRYPLSNRPAASFTANQVEHNDIFGGTLTYGVEMAFVAKDNATVGYYWWDPSLKITGHPRS